MAHANLNVETFFMMSSDVNEWLKSIKLKTVKGMIEYLIEEDGADVLSTPLSKLLKLIYLQ